jgi:hypothetical protein
VGSSCWVLVRNLHINFLTTVVLNILLTTCLCIFNPTVRATRSKNYCLSQKDGSSMSFKSYASQCWCNVPDNLKRNVSYVVFKKNIYQLYKTELLETVLRRAVPIVCNLSCIDSVLNYHSDDDD